MNLDQSIQEILDRCVGANDIEGIEEAEKELLVLFEEHSKERADEAEVELVKMLIGTRRELGDKKFLWWFDRHYTHKLMEEEMLAKEDHE